MKVHIIVGLLLISLAYSKVLQSSNITSTIIGYGYPLEVHVALTSDGYELILHRIPHGRTVPASKGVVLLQHGLTDSSAGYCLNAPDRSLAYILADNGYDVWIGNNRGNGYSMSNINFPNTDSRFWDFSWDEMALVDFPTIINYVLTNTKSAKISYIGHSEGTIQAFAGLISKPEIANQLHVFIALAPVAYVGGISVELLSFLARLDADEVLSLLGIHEFYLPNILHTLLPDLCKLSPSACGYGGTIFYGRDTYLNDTALNFYTDFEPFPTSAKNIMKWAQGVRNKKFEKFDYGTQGNIQHYGTATPPAYDIAKFPTTLPLLLVTGGIDGLADPHDVALLTQQLPVPPTVLYRADYGHLDPLLGEYAYQMTYPTILGELAKYH